MFVDSLEWQKLYYNLHDDALMHVIVETLDVYETDRQLLLNSCFYCNT